MKSIIVLSLVCFLMFSCKKKKDDASFDAISSSEEFKLDKGFGDNGSVLFYNNEYSNIQIRKNVIGLNTLYNRTNGAVCLLSTNGVINTTFGDWGKKEYGFEAYVTRFISEQKMILLAYGLSSNKISMDGEVVVEGFNFDRCSDVLELKDGKLLVLAGDSVFRLNEDQSVDLSFTITKFENIGDARLKLSDNEIFIFGSGVKKIIKIHRDGGMDFSFGNNGVKEISTYQYTQELYCDVYGNHLYIYYSSGSEGYYVTRIIRYNLDGTIDKGFGDSGTVLIDAKSPYPYINYFIRSLMVSKEGNVYAFILNMPSYQVIVKKLNNLGGPDKQFGKNGIYEISILSFLYDAKIREDEIYILGRSKENSSSSILMNYKLN